MVTEDTLKIAVSAGELSGDIHAAGVVRGLRKQCTATIRGMGGRNLRAEGVETIVDSEASGALMGFQEVLTGLGKSARALRAMKTLLQEWRPNVLLCVDYGDFNTRLAKAARDLGIKVHYHIPPKVWAWRSGRTRAWRKTLSRISVLFPFEKEFLQRRGLTDVSYVGHPFVEECHQWKASRGDFCKALGCDPARPIVAVLPGSRWSEIQKHATPMLAGIEKLREKHPEVQAIVAIADSLDEAKVRDHFHATSSIHFVKGRSRELMSIADAGLLKCGTSNLEAAFLGLPSVSFFITSRLSAFIAGKFVRLKEFSLVNIVRTKTIPELLQTEATPERVATEISSLLFDENRRNEMKQGLHEVVSQLSSSDSEPRWRGLQTVSDRVATDVIFTAREGKLKDAPYKRLLKYLWPYRYQFAAAICFMVLFGASDGAVPFLIKSILDGVFASQNTQLLYALPAILIVFAILRAAVDFGQQYYMSKVGHSITRDIRNELQRHLLKLNSDFYVTNATGNLLTRFTSDVQLVRTMLTDGVSSVLRDSIRVVALLATALYLDPVLACIAFIGFPLGIYPVYRFGKRMRRLTKEGQNAIGTLSAMAQETMLGHRVVKIFGREEHEAERFDAENQKLTNTFIKSERVRAITGPINEVLASIAVSGVILYGGYSVIDGTRTQGAFLAFLVSVFLLYDPFKKLSRVNALMQQGVSGAERVFEVLDTQPSVAEPAHPIPLGSHNSIEFKNVSFSYGAGKASALSSISFEATDGMKVALVGFSGAGKTTLVDLIPRFMDPQDGTVAIGGVDISKVSLRDLRERIAMVGQHTFLFNDTVFNNIKYGNDHATMVEVERASRAAHAFDFISKLPFGFETKIGEGGFSLSGGERQRIAIARALLKNAPILILDEATASLDNRSEREVQAALEALEEGRTTIVIAHRLSTVRHADRILVLRDGRIVEQGSHEELLKKGGEYEKLHALQFEEKNRPQVESIPDMVGH